MLESWNDGFKETSIQSAYDFIDFLVLMAYLAEKSEYRYLARIIKKSRFNISCWMARFLLLIPHIPSFHYSIIPYGSSEKGRKKYCDSLRGVGSPKRGLYEPEANKL